MPTEIKIPKLGLTMTEATLVEWSIGAGESATADQVVCVIETDKVAVEIQAPAAGLVHPVANAGKRVAVGEVIGYIAEDRKELRALQARQMAVPTTVKKEGPAPPEKKTPAPDAGKALPVDKPLRRTDWRIVASPAARKRSRELDVDLEKITGTGPRGRIVMADVEKAAAVRQLPKSDEGYGFGLVAEETELLSVAERIPIRGIRKIIAGNMKLSQSSQAQLTLHTEAAALALRDTRRLLNARADKGRHRVSYNAIIVKAAACALRLHPMLNAVVDGRTIKIWKQIHIGVAMDFGKGLLVPKVRNADTLSIPAIAALLMDLARRAKKRRLLPGELDGGTFTVTNLGAWDIDHFTPISNFPESAILGVGRIVEKPWVREGAVVAEPRLALSLTFDHRIVDGTQAARFLKAIKDRIEEPRLML